MGKKKRAATLSAQKTSPASQPDRREPQSRAAIQNDSNVARAKHWVDENKK
ncbi:MAG: DUF3787 domain-containing protein [Oscillospiraceae bacterium]|jgi:hypothetical protein|nr:DUF3787 domain-containing protein [Oscillospiraceae bacterium]